MKLNYITRECICYIYPIRTIQKLSRRPQITIKNTVELVVFIPDT